MNQLMLDVAILAFHHNSPGNPKVTVEPYTGLSALLYRNKGIVPIQVCQIPPPYVSTPTWTNPSPRFFETGFILKQGESVWAPTIEIELPGYERCSSVQSFSD